MLHCTIQKGVVSGEVWETVLLRSTLELPCSYMHPLLPWPQNTPYSSKNYYSPANIFYITLPSPKILPDFIFHVKNFIAPACKPLLPESSAAMDQLSQWADQEGLKCKLIVAAFGGLVGVCFLTASNLHRAHQSYSKLKGSLVGKIQLI